MHQGLRTLAPLTFKSFLTWLTVAMTTLTLWSHDAQASRSSLAIPGGGFLNLDAKTFSRDFDKGIMEVSGNVQVIFNQQYLSCDHAVINEKTHEIQADGNLVISSPQAYVEGESAFLNYEKNTATIVNGYVKSGQVIFEGKVVRKLGPENYEADHAFYTACTTCPTAWTFAGSEMSAKLGGYAFIKYPWLEIGGIKVLWLPYLIVPLKSERQSGLLIPNFEFAGVDGVVLGLRGFWAISRSQDATFTVKNYSLRGIKGLVNYRYMLSVDSEGEGNFGIIRDQVFSGEKIFANNPVGRQATRWFLTYGHSYELPYGISQKLDINLPSDLWYPRDFTTEESGWGDPALENRLSLTRNTEHTHVSAEVEYYVNMLKENPVSGNQDAVHRWPELRYAAVEQPVFGSNVLFNFNADYVNFARDGLGYDDVYTDATGKKRVDHDHSIVKTGGVFNPSTDLVRTGQRLDIKPELSYPIRAGPYFDLLPSIQGRFTQYAFNVSTSPLDSTPYDPSPYRDYVRGVLSMRTNFYRIYGRTDDSPLKAQPSPPATNWIDQESRIGPDSALIAPKHPDIYRHEIQPEIVASYVPYIRQPSDHPFFKQGAQVPVFLEDQPISNLNFDSSDNTTLQFDYYDRLTNRTLLQALVTNKLIRKRWLNGAPDYHQIASLKLGQSYDFDEAKREQAPVLPYSDIFAVLDVQLDKFDLFSDVRYFPYHRVTTSTSYARVKNESGTNFFQVGYSEVYNIYVRGGPETTKSNEVVSPALGVTSKYIDMTGSLNYNPLSFQPIIWELSSWAADFNIKPPGNCWNLKLHYEQPVGRLPFVHVDFDFKFGGDTG